MARKILIIFAFIIAAFPFLGFSETTDTTVTTTLSLLIAITLLFSRRPKMVPNLPPENKRNDMPSPFTSKMQSIPVAHPEEEAKHPVQTNIEDTPAKIYPRIKRESPVVTPDIPSPLPITPKRKTPVLNVEKRVEEISIPTFSDDLSNTSAPQTRRPRKNSPKVLLAYEEQVQPADIPTTNQTLP